MFEKEEQRVSIGPKESKKVRFVMQKADRVLTSVGITDGGAYVRFGDMTIGNTLWDRKPVPWPIAIFFHVEIHNDGESGRAMLVQAWHRHEKDDPAVAVTEMEATVPLAQEAETVRIQSPEEVLHTIRIRIRKGGAVDGDLDGDGPIYPNGALTTDGQCGSVLQEALLRIIALDQDRRGLPRRAR